MIYLSFDVYFLNENSFYVIYYTTTQLIYIRYYHNEGGGGGKEENWGENKLLQAKFSIFISPLVRLLSTSKNWLCDF